MQASPGKIEKTLFAALNTYVPKVNCKHANRPPWITSELAKAINKKKTLWRRIKKSKTPAKMEKFRKLRQHIKNWICFERRNYIKTIASEIHTNSKRFWTFFSFKNKRKPSRKRLSITTSPFLMIELVLRHSMPFLNLSLKNTQAAK